MLQHVVEGRVRGDAEVLVLEVGFSPCNFMLLVATDCNNVDSGQSVEQSMHMTLAHPT